MNHDDPRQSEPQGSWPPNPTNVILFCVAVMSFAVPWAWWAVR